MAVNVQGRLFASLGVPPGAAGRIHLEGDAGTATTPAALDVGAQSGAITFTAPDSGPMVELTVSASGLYAKGRQVTVERDSLTRRLRVRAR